MKRRRLSRRTLLRSAGVTLALPWLECLASPSDRNAPTTQVRRMLLISNNLGVLPKPFFPKESGADYELTPYLNVLAEFRRDFTVFSGLSHPGVVGGHSTENCFLTGARGPTRSGFRNQISLDQLVAEKLGQVTRFPSLNLGVNIDKANRSLSWTRDGVLLPAEDSAADLFRKMFVQGDATAVERQLNRLKERGTILDALQNETRQLGTSLGKDDRVRLDQYLTSVREIEERLQVAQEWELRPKPTTQTPPPSDIPDKKQFIQKFRLMLSMARLALESDSTRVITFMVDAFATPVFQLNTSTSTTDGYHNLSHHGQEESKVQQLHDVDLQQMGLIRELLEGLSQRSEGEERLLDRTMVLYGSNMGDSNTHDNSNLPILLAGGGFRHGQHLAFHREQNTPLCNLYVTMLRQLGLDIDQFSTSTGTVSI